MRSFPVNRAQSQWLLSCVVVVIAENTRVIDVSDSLNLCRLPEICNELRQKNQITKDVPSCEINNIAKVPIS